MPFSLKSCIMLRPLRRRRGRSLEAIYGVLLEVLDDCALELTFKLLPSTGHRARSRQYFLRYFELRLPVALFLLSG